MERHITRRGLIQKETAGLTALTGLAGIASLAAAGCAVGTGTPSGESQSKTLAPATVEVYYNFTPAEQPYLEKHTQAFSQKNPQLKINWSNTQGDEFYSKLTTMVAGGTSPDMSHMTSRWAGQFLRGQRSFTDLASRVKADKFDIGDFWPLLMEGFSDEEKRPMVLPYDITVQLLYYNADLLKASSAPLPTASWTLDDMLVAAQKATRKNGDQLEIAGYDGLPNGGQFEYGVERFGGRLLNDKLTQSEMGSPGSVQGIQFWTDLRHRHNVTPINAQQMGGLNMLQAFSTGKLALAGGGSGFASQVKATNASFDWDVVAVPRGPAGDPLRAGGGGYGLLKGAKSPDAAWLYLKTMTSNEVLMDMVGQPRRSVPGRSSVAKAIAAETSGGPKNWKVIVPVTEKARHITFGLTPKGGDVLTELMPALTRVYGGGVNVKTELETLSTKINAALSSK